jgi:hypothetical protein
MLMREASPRLQPGAYLIGTAPEAAQLSYRQLSEHVTRLVESIQRP